MSKYFTFSFDDGVTQDLRVIDIFKRHDFYGCTFFINTGLLGANWAWVGEQFGRPDVSHLRFTEEELKTGIYDGFDVAVHTLHHPSLSSYDDTPEKITEEVQGDADNIKRIFGYAPVGMSWPGGEFQATEKTIKTILETTGIRYSRGVKSTYDFSLPEDFMLWRPTCSLSDERTLELAGDFAKLKTKGDALFYVWCHAYELDLFNTDKRLDQLIGLMKSEDDIKCVTNTGFYNLFKAGQI